MSVISMSHVSSSTARPASEARATAEAEGSTNTSRACVLSVLGVLKVATTDQIQRISLPHLNHHHTDKPTPAKRKTARPATHAAALADMCHHRSAATGGPASAGEALRRP